MKQKWQKHNKMTKTSIKMNPDNIYLNKNELKTVVYK